MSSHAVQTWADLVVEASTITAQRIPPTALVSNLSVHHGVYGMLLRRVPVSCE